jgi:hypothetical protein
MTMVVVFNAGNTATHYFVPLALIASMVGLASVFSGTHHVRVFRNDSLSAAHSTALIAWLLTLLAMGYVVLIFPTLKIFSFCRVIINFLLDSSPFQSQDILQSAKFTTKNCNQKNQQDSLIPDFFLKSFSECP